jgi:hypothetical protein
MQPEQAVQRVVPRDLRKAAVLGFDWSNDTMDVKALPYDFPSLLRHVYGV